jgi:hypothetical protein
VAKTLLLQRCRPSMRGQAFFADPWWSPWRWLLRAQWASSTRPRTRHRTSVQGCRAADPAAQAILPVVEPQVQKFLGPTPTSPHQGYRWPVCRSNRMTRRWYRRRPRPRWQHLRRCSTAPISKGRPRDPMHADRGASTIAAEWILRVTHRLCATLHTYLRTHSHSPWTNLRDVASGSGNG